MSRRLAARSPVLIWNDPSVMKEEGRYSMWLSLGRRGGPEGVAIYKLTSPDGVDWELDNDGRPVLEPGDRKRGDAHHERVECVLRAYEPRVEQAERRRHQKDERRRNEHPGRVARIDAGDLSE